MMYADIKNLNDEDKIYLLDERIQNSFVSKYNSFQTRHLIIGYSFRQTDDSFVTCHNPIL